LSSGLAKEAGTLTLNNTYFVGTPDHATLLIQDNDDLPAPTNVATINGPSGIGYHPANTSLIISRSDTTGADKNFKRIASNGGPPSNWSTLSGLGFTIAGGSQGEIKVGIVQANTNGWTQGDLYFGSGQPGKIGKISADGSTVVNANWTTLTNSTQMVGETNVFVGGLYIDQTGVFGGDLIVVSGGTGSDPGDTGGAVWRVTASGNATKLAQVSNPANGADTLLEGVTTVPNDPFKYGPFAGKILTCAEKLSLLCTVDTNGTVATFALVMNDPEDADLVIANQNLFGINFDTFTHSNSTVFKIPKTLLTSFVDDIVIAEEVANELVMVHWDGARFLTRRLVVSGAVSLEHVTFAPIEAQP